jgi:hypothetical protein
MTIFQVKIWDGGAWSTTVEFDGKEVGFIRRVPNSIIEQIVPSYFKPVLIDKSRLSATSNERWVIEAEIIHAHSDTKDKVESLIDANEKLRVYYEYKIDSGAYKDMVLGKEYLERYKYGSQEAYVLTNLMFFGEV